MPALVSCMEHGPVITKSRLSCPARMLAISVLPFTIIAAASLVIGSLSR